MMEYKGYLGKAEYDSEANLLHGEVLGIRDVITFQARSVDELSVTFRASVDDYLAFCKKRGEQPDKPLSGKFVVRLDPRLHRKANLAAAASGMSLNAFVAHCLDRSVSHSRTASRRKIAPAKRSKRTTRGSQQAA